MEQEVLANNRINVLPLYTLCRYGKSSGLLMFLKLFTATACSEWGLKPSEMSLLLWELAVHRQHQP